MDMVGGSGMSVLLMRGMYEWLELIDTVSEFSQSKSAESVVARTTGEGFPEGIKGEMVRIVVAMLMNKTQEVAYVC
jgi:hypothetical protein